MVVPWIPLLVFWLCLSTGWFERARLRRAGLSPIWSLACQDSGHVGHAGMGVVSHRGAPLSLPSLLCHLFFLFILRTGLLDVFSRLALIFFVLVYWFKALPLIRRS